MGKASTYVKVRLIRQQRSLPASLRPLKGSSQLEDHGGRRTIKILAQPIVYSGTWQVTHGKSIAHFEDAIEGTFKYQIMKEE